MDDLAPWLDDERLPRVITAAGALDRGISRDAIFRAKRSGRWTQVLPRTYLTVPSASDHDRVAAALAYAGAGAALSGAAALWSLGVRRVTVPREILVIVPTGNCSRSSGWVRVRRSVRPLAYELAPGPRCVEVARAAGDLAVTMASLDDVRTLVARVVQHRHCTVAELAQALRDGPMRGSKHFRQALLEVGAGAASAPEARAAKILVAAGVTGWQQNVVLHLPDGSTRIVDFYWPDLRAVLEIDSVEWHFEASDWSATWDRHLDLSTFGYSVVHRPPSALRDPAKFVRGVQAWLVGREADLRRGIG